MDQANQTFNGTDHISLTLQYLATTVFALTSLTGLLAYVLVLTVFFAYFRDFKSNFYCIVISLSAADISFLSLTLFYVVPCTILQRHIWAPYDYWAGVLECLAYISQCTHLTFIAINRLAYATASSANPKLLDTIFHDSRMVAFWIILIWAISASVAMPVKLIGCHLVYHYEALDFMPDCQNKSSEWATHQATIADAAISGLLPVLITALHILTWLTVYTRGKAAEAGVANADRLLQRHQREKRILVQFTVISSVLLLWYISFWVIPEVMPASAGAVAVTLFGIISSGVNPFMYLVFNKIMKEKARYLIREKMLKRTSNAAKFMPSAPAASVRNQASYVRGVSSIPAYCE